jgi:DDE superfamily endonuclease
MSPPVGTGIDPLRAMMCHLSRVLSIALSPTRYLGQARQGVRSWARYCQSSQDVQGISMEPFARLTGRQFQNMDSTIIVGSICCFSNVVVIDHGCLFIYVEAGFAGSFHDVRRLRNTELHTHWRNHFRNDSMDVTQEYLLGDPGYMGVEMYILRRMDGRESVQGTNPVVDAFIRRHAARRVQVEWGIGGLKNRFRRFLS